VLGRKEVIIDTEQLFQTPNLSSQYRQRRRRRRRRGGRVFDTNRVGTHQP